MDAMDWDFSFIYHPACFPQFYPASFNTCPYCLVLINPESKENWNYFFYNLPGLCNSFFTLRYVYHGFDFPQAVVDKKQAFMKLQGSSGLTIYELEPNLISFIK